MPEIKSYLNNAKCSDEKWNRIFNHKGKDNQPVEDAGSKIEYVCADCGDLYLMQKQRMAERIFTWHMGECEMCGEETAIAHVRYFNWLRR